MNFFGDGILKCQSHDQPEPAGKEEIEFHKMGCVQEMQLEYNSEHG